MTRRMLMTVVAVNITVAVLAPGPVQADNPRAIDFGPWNGVVACESRGDSQALGRHNDAGLFQFIPSTFRWVADVHGRTNLAGKDPRNMTAAQQLRHAIRLRDMPGGGIGHWACGYRYGDGTRPIVVHGDPHPPKPRRCFRWMRKHVSKRVAASVCGYDR